jgi:hypothetical protein
MITSLFIIPCSIFVIKLNNEHRLSNVEVRSFSLSPWGRDGEGLSYSAIAGDGLIFLLVSVSSGPLSF